MNRIQTKLKAGGHLFPQAYSHRQAKRRQPITNGETMYAVQSVYSARKWRCRPVIAHISDVLQQPMRYTLVSSELFDELGRGSRLLRPDEWDDLERRIQCVGASAKVASKLMLKICSSGAKRRCGGFGVSQGGRHCGGHRAQREQSVCSKHDNDSERSRHPQHEQRRNVRTAH
eukprot:2691830-Rhodomonas_salina.1